MSDDGTDLEDPMDDGSQPLDVDWVPIEGAATAARSRIKPVARRRGLDALIVLGLFILATE